MSSSASLEIAKWFAILAGSAGIGYFVLLVAPSKRHLAIALTLASLLVGLGAVSITSAAE
jgi:hypothetical protein